MTRKIMLAVPPRIPASYHPYDPTMRLPPIDRFEVELRDGDAVLDAIMTAIYAARKENYELRGLMLSTVDYLTLCEHMRNLITSRGGRDPEGRGVRIDGVEFYMDPSRDEGPPQPIYDETYAIAAYAQRLRTTSARSGASKEEPESDGGRRLGEPNEDEKEDDLAELIRKARELPPMTPEEEREQAASFAYGQVALMKEWHDAPPEKLEELRQLCRRLAGCK